MFNTPHIRLVNGTEESVPTLEQLAVPITIELPDDEKDILHGLLPKDDIVVITGETNIGKSLLALEITSCLVTGNPLWGQLEPTKLADRVLYALGEHRTRTILNLAHKTQLPMTDKVLVLGPEKLAGDKWLVVQGKPNTPAIDKFKRWAEGIDFMVFDPLASFIVGSETENDNNSMRLLIEVINSICMVSGASCVVLGHMGKPSIDYKGHEHVRKTYATRGASGTEDSATNIFYFGKADGERTYDLTLRKFKGYAPAKYRLLRNPDTLTHTLLGDRPNESILKLDAKAKLGNMIVEFPQFDRETCLKITAVSMGIPVSTLKRRLED